RVASDRFVAEATIRPGCFRYLLAYHRVVTPSKWSLTCCGCSSLRSHVTGFDPFAGDQHLVGERAIAWRVSTYPETGSWHRRHSVGAAGSLLFSAFECTFGGAGRGVWKLGPSLDAPQI